jgi:nucleoside-diphosphate-sugar epimerase
MSHCLVIGGDGFIGRRVVQQLGLHERETIILCRKLEFSGELPKSCRYVCGDYSDRASLRRDAGRFAVGLSSNRTSLFV